MKESQEVFVLHLANLDEEGSKIQAIEDAGYSDGLLRTDRNDPTLGTYEVVRTTSTPGKDMKRMRTDFEDLGIEVTNVWSGDPWTPKPVSWKKRAAIAVVAIAALAGSFKLGYDTHKQETKIEVRTKTKYETKWKTKTITTTQTTPQTICKYMQRLDVTETTKELGLSGWLAVETTDGTTRGSDILIEALELCPVALYSWGLEFQKAIEAE